MRQGIRREFLLRVSQPGRIFSIADHAENDRHIGVVFTAKLGALAVIGAFLRGAEPGLVQASRHGVDADAERRHGEGMNDVRRSHLDEHGLVDRHHSWVIDRELAQISSSAQVDDELAKLKAEVGAGGDAKQLGDGGAPVAAPAPAADPPEEQPADKPASS